MHRIGIPIRTVNRYADASGKKSRLPAGWSHSMRLPCAIFSRLIELGLLLFPLSHPLSPHCLALEHRHDLTVRIGMPNLRGMDWKKITADLAEAGCTQTEIATYLGISQASVSDIATGKTRRPSWEIGDALLRLHKRVMRQAARRKEAA